MIFKIKIKINIGLGFIFKSWFKDGKINKAYLMYLFLKYFVKKI